MVKSPKLLLTSTGQQSSFPWFRWPAWGVAVWEALREGIHRRWQPPPWPGMWSRRPQGVWRRCWSGWSSGRMVRWGRQGLIFPHSSGASWGKHSIAFRSGQLVRDRPEKQREPITICCCRSHRAYFLWNKNKIWKLGPNFEIMDIITALSKSFPVSNRSQQILQIIQV